MRRVLLAILLVVVGCSKGTLDRKIAAEKINQEFSKRRERILVRIGRVGLHCETRSENGKTVDLEWESKYDVAFLIAQAAGYVDISPDGEGFWKISLNDRGQAFVNAYHIVPEAPPASSHCGYQFYSMPLATAQVVAVTGIIPDQNTCQAEVTWNWSLTELGKGLRANGNIYSALTEVQRGGLQDWLYANPGPRLPIPAPSDEDMKTLHHDTVQFVKYDDGWRIKPDK